MKKIFLFFLSLVALNTCAQTLPNPVMFCTQVPNPFDFTSLTSTFGNHSGSLYAAPRGGDLYIIYPDGTLKNITQLAGYGTASTQQGANAIAVRDPSIHWSGTKALFSMVIGAPTAQYQVNTYFWQIYEVTGLGKNETPVITKVLNQPNNYNNITPIYGTDNKIIFTSDRPRNGLAHLYPQHDEYESSPIVTGLWKFDPNSCNNDGDIEMLTHSPSGDFTPIIDSYGRIVFTRWDHLKRDQQADADIIASGTHGTFNYANENANAQKLGITSPEIEVFPEPRQIRTDLFALPIWANTYYQDFNIFNPWTMNENGTELETINHIGRHELAGNYFTQNFTNDPNLVDFNSSNSPNPNPIRSMFQIIESPTNQGLFYGIDCGEFGTHGAGQVISMNLPLGTSPEDVLITYLTHPETASFSDNPSPNHSGMYRNPLPLSNNTIIVAHAPTTQSDANIGTISNPLSRYNFRLRWLQQNGTYHTANGNYLTGGGISKTVSWWNPDVLITYSGLLWEIQPVEIKARALPPSTLNPPAMPAIEQSVCGSQNIDIPDLQKFLRANNLALVVTRDVTSRDRNDVQQPYNLKIFGSNKQTIKSTSPTNIYEIKYLQYLQGNQVRGIGGLNTPTPGRRIIAQFMDDTTAAKYNMPTTGATGSVNLASDGSQAAFVPANRAMTWQLTDANNKGIVRERVWLSFVPGEIRACTSCHGESKLNQAGLTSPNNTPLALANLLSHLKTIDTDGDGIVDLYDAFPNDINKQLATPLSENFTTGISNWINTNTNNDAIQWQSTTNDVCGNGVAFINNLAAVNIGSSDKLTQTINLTNVLSAALSFNVAYTRFNATRFDALKVSILTCNGTSTQVYNKTSTALATAPDQTTPFTPLNCNQWRTECIDISSFAGQIVQVVFENISGNGNKLYLDNISITETDLNIPPPTISGNLNVCTTINEIYTVASSPPTSQFSWLVTGGNIISGQGTNTITVNWTNGVVGNVSVQRIVY